MGAGVWLDMGVTNSVPATFFHGTFENLPEGTVLAPGATLGRDNHGIVCEHVCVTDDTDAAYLWGSVAAKNNGKRTVYVYEVRPISTPVPGNPTHAEWFTNGAEIVACAFSSKVSR